MRRSLNSTISTMKKNLVLGDSVFMSLISKLNSIPNSSYRAVLDNLFTCPNLLRWLKSKGIAATGTVRANETENSPLSSFNKMKKQPRGTCDVAVHSISKVTLVPWKHNKVVTVVLERKQGKQYSSSKTEVVR